MNGGGYRTPTEVTRRTEAQDDPRDHVEHRHGHTNVEKSQDYDERRSPSDHFAEREPEPRTGRDNTHTLFSRGEHNSSPYQNDYVGPVSCHSGSLGNGTARHSRRVPQSEGAKGSWIIHTMMQWVSPSVGKQEREDDVYFLQSEIKRIRASREEAVYARDREIRDLQQEISHLKDRNQYLLTGARSLELKADTYKTQLEDTRAELGRCKSQLRSCEAESQQTRMELSNASQQNGLLKTELGQKATLLETRTTELRTAETYLSKYDEIPGDEVVSLISNLNQLVLGVAEKCCDSFSFKKGIAREQNRSNEENEMLHQLSSIIGHPLVKFLLSKNHDEDPTIVQLSIQAALMKHLYCVVERWPIPMNMGQDFSNNFLSLYDSIHGQEMQTVAARWRALGSKHLRLRFPINFNDLIGESMHWIEAVLRAASGENVSPGDKENQINGDLARIWELVGSLAEKMKESVLSTDYRLIFIHPGSNFNENIAQSQGSVEGRSQVLCTTELGLMRVTNVQKAEGALSELETRVMSRSTVIFKHEIEKMFA
ncbi:hypothetical protein M0805_009936 [Coniferiporia weirii]|nr:hypothetical protein M0805_009936 [Coniferiporia weirii]